MAKIKMAGILNSTNDTELIDKLKSIEQDISDAVKQTRSITYELSPPVLHELGLMEALEWRLEKFTEETGIKSSIDHNINQLGLRNEQEVILFRSVSELLKNITKHAQASIVLITAKATRYSFEMKIQDDGNGFDISILKPQKRKSESFGLFSIKERIEYLGGVLEIHSGKNEGTAVTLIVPVSMKGI
ncbi:hypothetical protein HQ531_06430 [bacterium]|nr:hypothetical protein [bacterium]